MLINPLLIEFPMHAVDRFQIRNLLAPLIGGSVGAFVLVILILVCISLVSVCLMTCGEGGRKRTRYQGPGKELVL